MGIAIGVIVVLLVGLATVTGWAGSEAIRRSALAPTNFVPDRNLLVEEVDAAAGTIALRAGDGAGNDHGDWRLPGTFGITSSNAAGIVGDIVSQDNDMIVRTLVTPDAGFASGDAVGLDPRVWTSDPRTAHGIDFEEVRFSSEVGPLGAWLIPGTSSTWAIFVHGYGVGREEGLRFLPALTDRDVPVLMIQYRNDAGAPASASGRHAYGASEWRDVEAAVSYAHASGAGDVVLFGSSMGGAIVMRFLLDSQMSESVAGAILDSPALDLGDITTYGAERIGLWNGITRLGKVAAAFRFGLDWRALDYVARADELDVPILLIHGTADRTVHVRTSDALAAARPDLVTYLRPDGVEHVRAWNADAESYDAAIRAFMDTVTALPDDDG